MSIQSLREIMHYVTKARIRVYSFCVFHVRLPVFLMMKFTSLLLLSFTLLSFSSLGKKAAEQDKFASFRDKMEGVRFSGFFTMTGKDVPPMEETYEIQSVQKFGEEDLWIFTARVKYGKKDVVLPMPLPVKWVGDVPVITMKDLNIPGLGTFSAHVVIDGGKYAGTWSHGKVGGHLYGTIEKMKKEGKE